MAQTIQLKRSATAGNIPTSSDLALGEIAINTADGAVYIKKGNNDIVAVHDNDILHIDTTNSRVGIGKTNPNYSLDVNGGVNIASGNVLRWGSGDVEIVNSSYNLLFKTYDGSSSLVEHMRITSAGNVGIGTDSPDRKLEVDFTGSTVGAKFTRSDTTGSSTIEFANSAGVKSTIGFNAGTNEFDIKHNSAIRFAVDNNGAVTFNEAYTFPTADGSANQVLQTDGSGNLSFATVSGGGGVTISNNANNRVLTGDGTNANAEANLTFDGSTLDVTGGITGSGNVAIDTDTFVVSASNDRVGINVGTPLATLDIDGDVYVRTGHTLFADIVRPYATTEIIIGQGTNDVARFTGSIKIGTTTIVDSSRNLTNIGTISSGAITSSGNITTTNGLFQANEGNQKVRQYEIGSSAGTQTFLLGKIENGANADGGVTGTVKAAYDYGETVNNCNIHFTFAQRSGAARGHWWYENTDDDASTDVVSVRLVDDGAGGMFVWLYVGDYVHCFVEAVWRQCSSVTNSGTLSAGTITTGTTLFDTANDPTSEHHIGRLYAHNDIYVLDNKKVYYGNSNDLQIYHDSTDSLIRNYTGDLVIQNDANDKDIIFRSDDGSGGVTPYFKLDGANTYTSVSKNFLFQDNVRADFGNDSDLRIYHTGTHSYIDENGTGNLYIGSNNGGGVYINGSAETLASFLDDGAVTLYYDGSSRLTTTSTGIQVDGPNGNVTIGAQNTTGLHIYTDRDRFYFNKIASYITNSITSYSGDFNLQRQESTKLTLTSTGASVTGTLTAGDIIINTANTTISTTQPAIRKGGGGEMFLDAPGHIILNIDTNNNNTDRIFAVRTNSTTSNLFSVNESGNATVAGTINSGAITSTGAIQGTSFSDGTISGITFIDEDSFSTNSATRVPTQQSIKAYVDAQVAGVVDSAPAALNTLNELAAALGDDASFSTTTSTALGNRLRVDTASQGLTGTQQANAITNLGITATKAELNLLDGVTATTTELNYTDGVTSNIQTQLNGKLSTSGTAPHANNLNATDDRDIAPEDLSYNDDLRIYFAEKGGLETGTVGSNYQDVLVLNSYTDHTGGDANALAFDKSEKKIYHYQADQAATNWGTAKTLAYTDDITLSTLSITATATELNYTDGVTSNIQTQLNGKVGTTGNETITGNKTFTGTTTAYNLYVDNNTTNYIRLYTENNTTNIADTFTDTTTDKSYIYFGAGDGSNDPGFIMHETSEATSPDETNEGVLHLVPSDDNATNDYVSIHGTNDADCLKLHTSGLIETGSSHQLTIKSGSGDVYINDNLTVSGDAELDGGAAVTGNITVTGTVDGRDIATDGSKLDGIESGATADQTQSDINALGITQVGTISSGTWQGTAIASAYLDSDTAHLSGTQTFSGAKTFTNNVTIGNATYGSYGSGSTDITGLINGSTFGSFVQGTGSGHHVIGIRDNDNADSFAIISGSGNYDTDTTYDKLVFRAQADGTVTVGGGNLGVTGNITLTGTVDGRDVATDGTKLDTIATNADVTPSWVPSSDPGYLTSSSTQSKYLRSDANDTYTGTLSVAGTIQDSGDSRRIHYMYGTTSSQPAIGVGEQGLYGMKIRWDSSSSVEFDGFWNSSVTGARNRDLGDINVNTATWNLPALQIAGSTVATQSYAANASNLSSGTVPSARLSLSASDIPSLAASKITSGTFADARIAASSITQHTDSKYLRSDANDDFSGTLNYTPDTGTILSVDGQAILQRMTANGAITIGHDDAVIIAGGDTSGVLNTNINNATETVFLGAEGGVIMYAFPNNDITWTNRKSFSFDGANGLNMNSVFTVDINGNLSATTKSFDIEHPSKEGMRLRYGSLEGPENGVYVRGKSKEKVILLPDYWVDLVHEDSITVQLTAIGGGQNLYVEEIKDNKVYVNGENYFYYIQAERKDVERFEVEYES